MKMKARVSYTAMVFLVGILVLPFMAYAGQEECQVACSDAPSDVPMDYGCYGECSISSSTDTDGYSFEGSAEDMVRFRVYSRSYDYDARLEVRDPDGDVIVDEWCDSDYNTKCRLHVVRELTKPGTYRMKISEKHINHTGGYDLQIERVPPDYDPPGLGYDASETDEINPETDMDFLDLQGVAGTDIRINVTSLSYDYDPLVEVWTHDGEFYASKSCDSDYNTKCTLQLNLEDIPFTGTYFVAMSERDLNHEGSYQISLACLFGDCPLCTDTDEDGYGDPASPHCEFPELDCGDEDYDVNPGLIESTAQENCADGKDNDCDGLTDGDDPNCNPPWEEASAEASSVYGSKTATNSSVMNNLSFLLIPVGAVIAMRILRRKKY